RDRPPPSMQKRKPHSVALANTAIGIGLVLLIVGGAGLWRGRQVALDSRQRLSDIQRALSGDRLSQQDRGAGGGAPAPEAVRQACDQASELDRQLSPAPELAGAAEAAEPLVGRLPRVGDQAAGMVALVT